MVGILTCQHRSPDVQGVTHTLARRTKLAAASNPLGKGTEASTGQHAAQPSGVACVHGQVHGVANVCGGSSTCGGSPARTLLLGDYPAPPPPLHSSLGRLADRNGHGTQSGCQRIPDGGWNGVSAIGRPQ